MLSSQAPPLASMSASRPPRMTSSSTTCIVRTLAGRRACATAPPAAAPDHAQQLGVAGGVRDQHGHAVPAVAQLAQSDHADHAVAGRDGDSNFTLLSDSVL